MDGDENLDLFSARRRSLILSESNVHGGAMKLEGLSVGPGKFGRSPMDDLLSSELGKHDYDWLLTPPGTPPVSSSDANEHRQHTTVPKGRSNARSVSTTKASRLSVSQCENGQSTRPARSVSAMRPSISTTHSSSHFSHYNRTSILNTSSASVTSRPSTPGNRLTTASSVRSSAPVSRPVSSRSSTPVRTRPPPGSTGDIPKSANSSRPSTPTARPQLYTAPSSNPSGPRPSSRSSTPTRRTPSAALATTAARAPSVGRASTITRPASRPSSPSPRARPPVHPIVLPDFPLDVPPNLRTKLPERPASAGRVRPGTALTVRTTSNTEAATPVSSNRRNSSPIVTRGRFPENSPKARVHSNGNEATPPDIIKLMSSDTIARKPIKPASATESSGFGRNISKKSLDMALKHMDIRQNIGGIRGTSIFPHSIRTSPKSQTVRSSQQSAPTINNGHCVNENGKGMVSEKSNGAISENGGTIGKPPDKESFVARTSNPDPYGSYRYDAILLKEDAKSMNWLHSIEDESDQSPEFDHRFEPLPEPFAPL